MREGSEHSEQAGPWKVFRSFLASVFERHWNYRTALGCAVVVAVIAAGYGYTGYRSYKTQHAYERGKAAEHQTYEISKDVSGAKSTVPGSRQPDPAEARDYGTYYDLKAQQDMAEWTYSLLWVGIVGFIASIVGIGFVYANLREMQAQTLATREIGENQTKAYAWVEKAEVRFPNTDEPPKNLLLRLPGPPNIAVRITVRNDGNTPAVQVSAWATIEIFSESGNAFAPIGLEYTAGQKGDPAMRVINHRQPEPMWLFMPDERGAKSDREAGVNALARIPTSPFHLARFEIVGTLQYRDVFKKWYHSPFKFWGYVVNDGKLKEALRSEDIEVLFQEIDIPRQMKSQAKPDKEGSE